MDGLIETDLEDAMMKFWVIFTVVALIVSVALLAQDPAGIGSKEQSTPLNDVVLDDFERERIRIFEFSSVNPITLPAERYIWTPRDVYLVGDKIPLYIETVVVREGFGTETVWPVSWLINTGLDTLKIKRGKWLVSFDWGGDYGMKDPYPYEENRSDYIPPIEEIDLSRLHGRLVFPADEIGTFGIKSENVVKCGIGECFVTRLIDLTAGWKIKKSPDGRILVRLVKCDPGKRKFEREWADIRGVYKVQYERSNIIEFEIR